jgi:hypothetical protein
MPVRGKWVGGVCRNARVLGEGKQVLPVTLTLGQK